MNPKIVTEVAQKLEEMGIEVVEGKVRKTDLPKVVQAAKLIMEPKVDSYSTKDGTYAFQVGFEEDYSQKFTNETASMNEDEAFEYWEDSSYSDWTQEKMDDVVYNSIRNLSNEISIESAEVRVMEAGGEHFDEAQWTKEKAAESLKKYRFVAEVIVTYEMEVPQRTKLEVSASNAIKNLLES